MGKLIPKDDKPKYVKCDACNGTGKKGKEECKKCHGTGKRRLLTD